VWWISTRRRWNSRVRTILRDGFGGTENSFYKTCKTASISIRWNNNAQNESDLKQYSVLSPAPDFAFTSITPRYNLYELSRRTGN
jgi:hypothetical protein